jgi:hypothetical protein
VRIAGLLTMLALLLTASPAAIAGGPVPFTFTVYIGGCSVSGLGPNSASITITLKNAEGQLKAKTTVTSDSSGNWHQDYCLNRSFESGDKVTASTASLSRTFTIPTLTATVDRQTDLVKGFGPPSTTLQLSLYSCITFGCTTVASPAVSTDGAGKFQKDFTGTHDTKGGDYVYVYWTSPHGDTVATYTYFAMVDVILGRSEMTGDAAAGQGVSITLKHGSTVKGTAHAAGAVHGNYFNADFRRSNGTPALPDIGDTVKPSFGSAFTLTNISVVGHASTEMVTGKCPAHRPFQVYAHDPSYPYRAQSYSYQKGTAGATGTISADTHAGSYPTFNLSSGDEVILSCMLGSGDIEGVSTLVP